MPTCLYLFLYLSICITIKRGKKRNTLVHTDVSKSNPVPKGSFQNSHLLVISFSNSEKPACHQLYLLTCSTAVKKKKNAVSELLFHTPMKNKFINYSTVFLFSTFFISLPESSQSKATYLKSFLRAFSVVVSFTVTELRFTCKSTLHLQFPTILVDYFKFEYSKFHSLWCKISMSFDNCIESSIHQHITTQNSLITQEAPSCHPFIINPFLHSHPQQTDLLFFGFGFVSQNQNSFVFFRMSYQWNHAIFSLWDMSPSTQQNAFRIHPCCFESIVHSSLMLNSIPLNGCTTLCLPIHPYMAFSVNISFQLTWVNF